MNRPTIVPLLAAILAACLATPALAQGRGLGRLPGGIGGFGIAPPVGLDIPPAAGGIPASVAGGVSGLPAGVGAGLGGVGPPATVTPPILPTLPAAIDHTLGAAGAAVAPLGQAIRDIGKSGQDLVGRPINARAIALAVGQDPMGHPIIRDQILAVSPDQASLVIAQRLHFHLEKIEQLGSLGLSVAILTAPSGMSAADGLAALRQADPGGTYDYDHLYNPMGSGKQAAATPSPEESVPELTTLNDKDIRLGMVDGGIDKRHRALQSADIRAECFVPGCSGNQPTLHGTAIASLLVGRSTEFSGYLPGAHLYAADVFGGAVDGGSAEEIANALNWLAGNGIAVTNVSLAGPPNALLGAAVKAFVGSGHILVAAVGNGGPAASLSYPAAYPGVVAVTSVDNNRHLEVDASPGAQFAALGVNVSVARMGGGYARATGTSYAVPVVTARMAQLLPTPDSRQSLIAREQVAQGATAFHVSGQTMNLITAPSVRNNIAASIGNPATLAPPQQKEP